MEKAKILKNTRRFVKTTLQNAEGGHDWFHIQRVIKNSREIAAGEDVDHFIVELGALLHDIADSKFHNGDESVGPKVAREFLKEQQVPQDVIDHVVKIIENISFKGGNIEQEFTSPELDVIQDADRLDALGAIGIARTFNYGGHKGRALYDPAIKPNLNMSKEEYKASNAPTVNHFYEKLFLLKDRMNTETGKKIAGRRHQFMELFLEEFYSEWGTDPDEES
jgi:uncharacterized protein